MMQVTLQQLKLELDKDVWYGFKRHCKECELSVADGMAIVLTKYMATARKPASTYPRGNDNA